jgi:hypothetical protein
MISAFSAAFLSELSGEELFHRPHALAFFGVHLAYKEQLINDTPLRK